MENEQKITEECPEPAETPKGYVPRPKWQLLLAWIGLILIGALLLMQIALMLRGGGL